MFLEQLCSCFHLGAQNPGGNEVYLVLETLNALG